MSSDSPNPEVQDSFLPTDTVAVSAFIKRATAAFNEANSLEEIQTARQSFLGDKSPLTLANRQITKLSPEEKKVAGQALGKARKDLTEIFTARQSHLQLIEEERALAAERVDITLPVDRTSLGARHPLRSVQEEIEDFFLSIGWSIEQGPEVEAEWFNFDALNFLPDHPARQMQDTFYVKSADVNVDSNIVLRTHTSPVQARTLLHKSLPVYIACPGRVFRTDELDATHSPVFHQIEGLAVDRGLTMANLVGVLEKFAQAMFGSEAKVRLRPSFFPFTEPSAELDLWFPQKKGGPGWIEWGGCGMVNENVLRSAGLDPDEFTGFAFGMGLERTLLLRHGISDMRDVVEGDVRFTQQFGVEF